LKGVVSPTVWGRRKYGHVYETGRAVVCTLLYVIMAAHICSDKCTVIIIKVKLLMSCRLRVRKCTFLSCFPDFNIEPEVVELQI